MGIKEIVIFQKCITGIGGAEIFALNLLSTFNTFSHYDLIMITTSIDDDSMGYISSNYPDVMNRIIVLKSNNNLELIKHLYGYYQEKKVFFTLVSYGYKDLFIINKLLNIKYYVLYHDSIILEEDGNQKYSHLVKKHANKFLSDEFFHHVYDKKVNLFKRLLYTLNYFLVKIIVNDATKVCVLSDFSSKEKKLIYGINPIVIKAALMKKDIIDDNQQKKENYFLSVSRLVEKKNVHKIINGFNQYIKKYGSGYTLKIIGEGPYKDNLLKIVDKLGIEKYVEFCGFVSNATKIELYNKASLFICLDNADFDLTFYEALNSRTKVLCSEMFEVDGCLFDNNANIVRIY